MAALHSASELDTRFHAAIIIAFEYFHQLLCGEKHFVSIKGDSRVRYGR